MKKIKDTVEFYPNSLIYNREDGHLIEVNIINDYIELTEEWRDCELNKTAYIKIPVRYIKKLLGVKDER